MELEVELSSAFSDCALKLIHQLSFSPKGIGCHGQTVRHRPEKGFTKQLAQGALIANQTGIPTVTDFRSADIAVGGQGAPLTPAFHEAFFGCRKKNRAIVNIGGISNISILTKTQLVGGFDIGPGNTLMDYWYRLHNSGSFDKDGNWSLDGIVDESLVRIFLKDKFFLTAPPKSTGLEYFNSDWLTSKLSGNERPVDVQATLRSLTARAIALAIEKYCPGTDEIFLCGGGAKNTALFDEISTNIATHKLETTIKLGIDPQWVEACAFAWLAFQRLNLKTGNIPQVTGANKRAILGGLYLP